MTSPRFATNFFSSILVSRTVHKQLCCTFQSALLRRWILASQILRGSSWREFHGMVSPQFMSTSLWAALGQHRSGACSYCRARYRLPNRVCFVTVVVLSRVRSTLAFSHWSLRSYLHASHMAVFTAMVSPGFAASQFLRLLRDSSMSPLWTADARKMRFSFSCPCSHSSVAVLFCFVALFLCWLNVP